MKVLYICKFADSLSRINLSKGQGISPQQKEAMGWTLWAKLKWILT